MYLHVRSGWAHFRATMAEPFTRRRSFLGEPLSVDDPNAGGGGGGGGGGEGDGKGAGGGDKGAGGAGDGGGTPEEQAARKAADDKRLTQEAANWRTKLRQTEKEFGDFKTAKDAEIGALKSQLEELETRISEANPQGGADKGKGKGGGSGTPDPEIVKLQRTVKELGDNLKTVREERDKERNQLRSEKIQRRVSELTTEGKFVFPKIFAKGLTDKIDIATDGEIILKVKNEAGGIDEVPATIENVMKHKPVDDFESFIKSEGSGGSGGSGGSRVPVNDGIDWNKVRGPGKDLDYIAKNMTKINAALAAQGNTQ